MASTPRHGPARPRRPRGARLRAAAPALAVQLLSTLLPSNSNATAADMPAAERTAILALGPWPPPLAPDRSNRVSGQAQAIELGRRLFSDPRMSPVGYIACVTCHQPDRAFTDHKARAHGLADLPRNTPGLANLAWQRWFGWGGASDSLWMASIRPMLDAREFDGNPASVAALYRRDPELAACYRRVFGDMPGAHLQRTLVNTGKALAAFMETMVTPRTPFDDFRDALARGDAAAMAAYPAAARRGLALFVGRAGCSGCHRGANLSDGEFHRLDGERVADSGRLGDLSQLRASAFNREGRFSDDRPSRSGPVPQALPKPLPKALPKPRAALAGAFRTPSLRNVAVTGPYLHDGRIDDLRAAVQHAVPSQRSVALTTDEATDLVAWLETLTDRYGERRPWPSAEPMACP